MDKIFLRNIRFAELDIVTKLLSPDCNILEIGAGAGWQARELESRGFKVTAVDVNQSSAENYNYRNERVFEIIQYDGHHLPFENGCFDAVFSSNVLEHIPHVELFQSEIMRVLKKDGVAIHILPTSIWRFWTGITFYFVRVINRIQHSDRKTDRTNIKITNKRPSLRSFFPPRHGETGTLVSELYLFSYMRWSRLFRRSGWKIKSYNDNHLFYTGEQLFGRILSITLRRKIAVLLGSACHIFVLKK